MASPIILQIDDEAALVKYSAQEDLFADQINNFISKYNNIIPNVEERFSYKNDGKELHFMLGNNNEYQSTDTDDNSKFLLAFFESNLDNSRPINGFGGKLDESIYRDLFDILQDKGDMNWASGNNSLPINFVGDFSFSSYCFVKESGCFWEIYEEEDYEEED